MNATALMPDQQQQEAGEYQEAAANGYHRASGSVGPFFAVFSVIVVLAAISCVVGRVCGRRKAEESDGRYDCSACCKMRLVAPDLRSDCWQWVRRKCRHCLRRNVEGGRKVVDDQGDSQAP